MHSNARRVLALASRVRAYARSGGRAAVAAYRDARRYAYPAATLFARQTRTEDPEKEAGVRRVAGRPDGHRAPRGWRLQAIAGRIKGCPRRPRQVCHDL